MSGSPKNKNSSEMSDQFFFFVIGTLLTLVLWHKYGFMLILFYFKWRIAICAFIAALVTTLLVWMHKRFTAWMKPKYLERSILGKDPNEDSLLAGVSDKKQEVYIKQSFRRMHAHVVGTTNAGKTESVICPWAVDDIKKGRGLLIIDGKSDRSLLDKLYAYAVRYNRQADFKILSLANPSISHTFNPFDGGSVIEVAERLFNALNFENEYYKSIQYDVLVHCLLIFEAARIKPTAKKVIELLRHEAQMSQLVKQTGRSELIEWGTQFLKLPPAERESRTSGLVTQLQSFSLGEMGVIFNSDNSDIVLEKALERGEIIYCQLPAMKIPSLGKATGKIVLQSLQSAISSRHLGSAKSKQFFSVYLDDFTEYLTPSFVTLLNKSRSANVGIVFAHQALGDLDVLGEGLKNAILTNSNLKVFMRTNEPESAEYFSSVIGTMLSKKVTERQTKGVFGAAKTGEGSVRETEEFKFHPNLFKQGLGTGEAVVVLPHAAGSLPVKLKFYKLRDLASPDIPQVEKSEPRSLPRLPKAASIADNNAADMAPPKMTDLPPGSLLASVIEAAALEDKPVKIGGAA